YWDATSLSIQILLDSGEGREALEAAERARSRAFLDLLAAKGASPKPALSGADLRSSQHGLEARATSAPASTADAVALARRLNSTMLAYWVDDQSTVIWTVSPEGRVAHVRTPTGAPALEKWIDEALGSAGDPAPSSRVPVASRSGTELVAGRQTRAA